MCYVFLLVWSKLQQAAVVGNDWKLALIQGLQMEQRSEQAETLRQYLERQWNGYDTSQPL